jgi:hypothetical protein
MIACATCQRDNREHRGYCGQCGVTLQPVCRGCRFVNEAHDKFCGGCGSALVGDARGPALSIAVLVAPPLGSEADEIRELFAPVAVTPDDSLPSAGITQADLDRLFGVGT